MAVELLDYWTFRLFFVPKRKKSLIPYLSQCYEMVSDEGRNLPAVLRETSLLCR